jgi:hypothetical protein
MPTVKFDELADDEGVVENTPVPVLFVIPATKVSEATSRSERQPITPYEAAKKLRNIARREEWSKGRVRLVDVLPTSPALPQTDADNKLVAIRALLKKRTIRPMTEAAQLKAVRLIVGIEEEKPKSERAVKKSGTK